MSRITPEDTWQRQLVDLAAILGYHWLHVRPGIRQSGAWSVPVSGTLGVGWPDLVLVRERDRRIVFVELKAPGGKLTADQQRVLGILRDAGAEVYVWWPHQLDEAYAVLDSTPTSRSAAESVPLARPSSGAPDARTDDALASSGPLPVSGAGAGRSTTEDTP